MTSIVELASKLSTASIKKYNNPYEEFHWPITVEQDKWFFSEDLISINGTKYYDSLTTLERKRLSFWESVNFFSLNIHGEKSLLEGLSRQLYREWPAEISSYLHHFVDEENKHMSVFGNFCMRYADKIYPSKSIAVEREYVEGEEDFLFFVRVVIFEELVDYYNAFMGRDDSLHPLAQQINLYHHKDETRHLAFGRKVCQQIYNQHKAQWSDKVRQSIKEYIHNYLIATWREYYNPQVYKDSGIPVSGYEVYETAWDSNFARTKRKKVSASCVNFLCELGIFDKEPDL